MDKIVLSLLITSLYYSNGGESVELHSEKLTEKQITNNENNSKTKKVTEHSRILRISIVRTWIQGIPDYKSISKTENNPTPRPSIFSKVYGPVGTSKGVTIKVNNPVGSPKTPWKSRNPLEVRGLSVWGVN